MKKKELYKKFIEALEKNKDIEVVVSVPGQEDPERIINTNRSINNKLLYYMSNYDEDLIHNKAKDVRILEVNIIGNEECKIAHCENCLFEFPINGNTKIEYGAYGCPYTICPSCNQKTHLDELVECENITPTNLSFPRHFYYMNGVQISDKEIEEWCKKAYNYLLANPEEAFYYTATGNSICIGLQDEEEIMVFVAQNYYDFAITKNEKSNMEKYRNEFYEKKTQNDILYSNNYPYQPYYLDGGGMSTSPMTKIQGDKEEN